MPIGAADRRQSGRRLLHLPCGDPTSRAGSAIVNVTSMAGHRGSHSHADYAAAKSGVLGFSRSLAIELAPKVRVNAVSPGLIDTPMVRPLMAAKGTCCWT